MDHKTLKAHLCATATARVAKIIDDMVEVHAKLYYRSMKNFPSTWEDCAKGMATIEIEDRIRAINADAKANQTLLTFLSWEEICQIADESVDLVVKTRIQAAGQHAVDGVFEQHGANASHATAEWYGFMAMRTEAAKLGAKFDANMARAFAREAVEYRSLITEEDW